MSDVNAIRSMVEVLAAGPPNYQVAIPSYRRAEGVQKTLGTLDRLAVDRDRVTVWVADGAEAEQYRAALPGWRVDVSAPGLVASRRAYSAAYPPRTPLLNFDDDVEDILALTDGKLAPWNGSIHALASIGFGTCRALGLGLWGVSAAANAFYLDDSLSVGLRYICGILHGTRAGDPDVTTLDRPANSSGEDFETTLRSFRRYNGVARINWLTVKTRYFAPGGMQAELGGKDERNRQHDECLREIAARFQGLATVVTKAGGVTNLKLRTVSRCKVSRSVLEEATMAA